MGEAFPPTGWRNRGAAAPLAAMETMLWAAAGGDVATLGRLLHLEDPVKAGDLFARLGQTTRSRYADVQALVAAFTAKSIPIGDAQLVWHQQHGPDAAIACLWIDPPTTDTNAPEWSSPPRPNDPPRGPAQGKRSVAFLQLRRVDEQWKLVVPDSAVTKLGQELGARP